MPGHKDLAQWYFSLERLLGAGIPLIDALRETSGVPERWRRSAAARLEAGETWDAVLGNAPRWLPWTDRYILSAGAEAGRLPETLPIVRALHEEAAASSRQMLSALIYPLLLIHLAVLLFPLPSLMMEDGPSYASLVLPALLPLWAVLGVLAYGLRSRWAILRVLGRRLPGLRGAMRTGALSRFTAVLRALYLAGAPLEEAWFGAGQASGDPALARTGRRMVEVIRAGEAPGRVLEQMPGLPPLFVRFYRTGETSGRLEETLGHLQKAFQEESLTRLRTVTFWYPKILYFGVVAYLAWQIVLFFQGYVDMLDGLF